MAPEYSFLDDHVAYQRHLHLQRLQHIFNMAPFLAPKPPIITSQTAHQICLNHLLHFLDASYYHPDILARNPLFVFYETLYPHSDRSSVRNSPRLWPHHFDDAYTYPPPFHKLLEDCLIFYCEHLDALLPIRKLDDPAEPEIDPREGFLNILRALGKTSGESAIDISGGSVRTFIHHTTVAQRWRRGLLREGQIRLLEIVIRTLLDELSAIIKAHSERIELERIANRPPTVYSKPSRISMRFMEISESRLVHRCRRSIDSLFPSKMSKLLERLPVETPADKPQPISNDLVPVSDELSRSIHRCRRSITSFFGSERFRSERLETLLLKYLAEEGVNMEVVRGLEAAQRAHEDGK